MKRAQDRRDQSAIERVRRIAKKSQIAFPVDVVFTFNRSTMISFRRRRDGATLRMHDAFRNAPAEVISAVVRSSFLSLRKADYDRCNDVIHEFLRERHDRIELANYRYHGPQTLLDPKGQVHDLTEILHRVRRRYFPAKLLNLDLTWTKKASRHVMGQWSEQAPGINNQVAINSLLDDVRVPERYLDYLMFHEILHEVLPPRLIKGRRVRHFPEFKERERQFVGYDQAIEWERNNVARLFSEWERRQWPRRRQAASQVSLPGDRAAKMS